MTDEEGGGGRDKDIAADDQCAVSRSRQNEGLTRIPWAQ